MLLFLAGLVRYLQSTKNNKFATISLYYLKKQDSYELDFMHADKHQIFLQSVLINQFVAPTFCLGFSVTGINFWGMLHHVCDMWPITKTGADQSELVNIRAQID